MQAITLNSGVPMPLAGYGVFQIPDPQECERSVVDTIRVGYRLIDTAASYLNEEAVGRGIRAAGVPRNELFVTTMSRTTWPGGSCEKGSTGDCVCLRRIAVEVAEKWRCRAKSLLPFG